MSNHSNRGKISTSRNTNSYLLNNTHHRFVNNDNSNRFHSQHNNKHPLSSPLPQIILDPIPPPNPLRRHHLRPLHKHPRTAHPNPRTPPLNGHVPYPSLSHQTPPSLRLHHQHLLPRRHLRDLSHLRLQERSPRTHEPDQSSTEHDYGDGSRERVEEQEGRDEYG